MPQVISPAIPAAYRCAASSSQIPAASCLLTPGHERRSTASSHTTWAAAFPPLPGGELAPGHTLVISTAHSLGVIDAPPADLAAAMALVQCVGRAMQTALGATGIVVLNASGPDSGQSVAHLHFHVVPCWADDEVTFWPASRSRHQLAGTAHELLADALAGEPTAPAPPHGQPS
jgi:histidine triad (HIT) family protein